MAASTNAGSGYVITVNGATLTSGGNTITAMNAATTSVPGTGQFGLNLKANSTPSVGTEVAPAANGTNYRGQAAAGYSTADTFKFTTGDTVANSYNGGAGGTDAQIFFLLMLYFGHEICERKSLSSLYWGVFTSCDTITAYWYS